MIVTISLCALPKFISCSILGFAAGFADISTVAAFTGWDSIAVAFRETTSRISGLSNICAVKLLLHRSSSLSPTSAP